MRYRVNSEQVVNETIDGEAIMIDLATGSYYSLDRVGGDIWSVLEQGATADEIVEVLEALYDAQPGDIGAGVNTLLERLVAENLIVEDGEAGANGLPPVTGAAGAKQPFTAPRLDK